MSSSNSASDNGIHQKGASRAWSASRAWRVAFLIFMLGSLAFFIYAVRQVYCSICEAETGFTFLARGENRLAQQQFDKARDSLPHVSLLYAMISPIAGKNADDFLARAIALDPNSADLHMMRARYYVAQKQYDRALSEFTEGIRLTPSGDSSQPDIELARHYKEKANLQLQAGHFQQALRDSTLSIRYNPDDPEAYQTRAEAYRQLGDNKEAEGEEHKVKLITGEHMTFATLSEEATDEDGITEDDFLKWNQYISNFNESPYPFLERASLYQEQKQYPAAIADLGKAIELMPDNAEAYLRRANAYDEMGEREKALADYNRAISISNTAGNLLKRAEFFDSNHQYKLAIADCDSALAMEPKREDILWERADAYSSLNDLKQAASDLEMSVKLSHSGDDMSAVSAAYEKLAGIYTRMGETGKAEQCFLQEERRCDAGYVAYADFFRRRGLYDQALRAYQTAIQHGDELAGYEGKGDVYMHQGKPADALAAFSQAVKLDSGSSEPNPMLFLKRSHALQALGKTAQARQDEESAVQTASSIVDNKKDSASYHDRGLVYQMLGQHHKAIADFRTSQKLDPTDHHLQYHIARSLIALNKPSEAIAICSQGVQDDPTATALYEGIGDADSYEHQYQKAVASYTRAWEDGFNDCDALEKRSLAYQSLGEKERARRDHDDAVCAGYDPDSTEE